MFDRLRRFWYIKDRTEAWNQADHDYKQAHKRCELCNIASSIECHDILPYRKLTVQQKNDYNWLMHNMISLCDHCHKQIAHCGDKDCLKFNTQIVGTARYVRDASQWCTT